jgi:hypothetical protein
MFWDSSSGLGEIVAFADCLAGICLTNDILTCILLFGVEQF